MWLMFQYFAYSWTWNNLILTTEGGKEHWRLTLLWLVDHVIKDVFFKETCFSVIVDCYVERNTMNIDLIAYCGFDLDLKLLTTVTKYATLTQIAYTWLHNNRKKNEWTDGTSILSRQYPVSWPPCSPAAEKPTLSFIHMPDICFLLSWTAG